MTCKVELYKDIFQLFKWADKMEFSKKTNNITELSAFSIYGTADIDFEDKRDFFKECTEIVTQVFDNLHIKFEYKLYLFVALEIENPISRIAKYKKVWKKISEKWELLDFELGPELIINNNNKYYYSGLARFELKNLLIALEIQHSNITNNFVFSSCRGNFLSEKMLQDIFYNAFNKLNKFSMFSHDKSIDYFNIFANYCNKQDIIFRIGDSAEEVELDLVFSSNLYNKSIYSNIKNFKII